LQPPNETRTKHDEASGSTKMFKIVASYRQKRGKNAAKTLQKAGR
jgi:hypothetical protein